MFEGLSQRISQVFGCICLWNSANDEMKALARVFSGRKVEYPYAFMKVGSLAANPESYNTNMMARRGLTTTVSDGFTNQVRLLPANFEVEVKYVTNRMQGFEQGSVLAFSRRWLFARRCGYLKFNIKYGKLALWIASTLSETVTTPELGNKVEQETAYSTVATLTIHGYVSEPILGMQGTVQSLQVNGVLLNADGSLPGSQFFSFNQGEVHG